MSEQEGKYYDPPTDFEFITHDDEETAKTKPELTAQANTPSQE